MITTKADKLLKSLIDAGLSLTDFTILATKVIQIQRDFKTDNEDRRNRDRLRHQEKLREKHEFEQQLKEEEQRKLKGLAKLRELGYVTSDDTSQTKDTIDQYSANEIGNKDNKEQLLLPYSKEINHMKEKQRDCCLTFNIDYDLRLNQQALERACKRAKRNIYELRAERFSHPEHRSVLSVETATLHNKLKEAVREINKIFLESKSNQDKRHLQELLTYINQFEGDIDLLMCQMQYEPKVKETILFSPVTTDILDRMNLILYYVRILAQKISTGDYINESNKDVEEELINNSLSSLPTKVTYIIKVKTNDELSSSLSNETNVTMKLYGTYNKSPDIRLIQSIHKTKWQPGQIDLFNIELNYLGDLYAIEIWHDGEYSSWKVDWIEIIDDAANIYRFPLNRLFDKYSDEKKTRFIIQSDNGPVNRLPAKPVKQIKPYKQLGFSTYTVQVKTGKQPNKATDSKIFMQLKGENGEFSDHLSSSNSAMKSSVFEPDQLDTFYLIWPYLSKLHSLNLSVQSEGNQPAWFCEYINVEDSQTGEHYKFVVNQLFDGSNLNDSNLKNQLTIYPEKTNQKDEKDKPSYLLKLKTGEKGLSDMSTLPPISIILKGEKGKSEPFIIKSSDKKKKLFQENQTDEFILPEKHYVGPVKSLQISSNEKIDKWFIENIILRDIHQAQDYIFPIYKWINKSDGTNTLTVQPINEQKPDYIVYTRTIASELNGPDRAIKLLLQGSKGKHEIELSKPVSMGNAFQSGRKDEYYIENLKSLGDLQSIELDITHPNIKKLGLDYIEIKDLSTNDSYRFNINRMLDARHPKMTAKAESIPRSIKNGSSTKTTHLNKTDKKDFDQLTTNIPQGAKRPIVNHKEKQDDLLSSDVEYKVSIKTGDSSLIDTNSNVQLQLHGDKGTSKKINLDKSQRNNQDTFSLNIPDLGNLKSATLSLDEKTKNEWSVSTLEIVPKNSKTIYHADINQKLDEKNSKLTVNLSERSKLPKTISEQEKNMYQIKLKTMDKQFLGNDTKLQIELINQDGQSETTIVNPKDDPLVSLRKDKIDTLTIEPSQSLGKLKTVKLSLVGSKSTKKDFYQPKSIEIFDPKTNRTHRVEYTKDDILNSDSHHSELTKSLKLLPNTNIHEKAYPQGTSSSKPTHQSSSSSYKKLADSLLSENDEDDLSLPNNTTTSSEMNSFSEKLTHSSSRQIRPGDRVKNSSKRQSIDQQSKIPAYEADWYRRSVETNRDHRNEAKQMQLISNKHTSQTKFDQQQAQIIKKRSHEENSKIYRQLSKEKKINSHPNLSKQQKKNELPTRSSISNTQQQLQELQREMMDHKPSTNRNVQQKAREVNELHRSSLSKQIRSADVLTNDQRQKTKINGPTPSNVSEITNSTRPNGSTYEQSKISTTSSKIADHISAKEQSRDRISIESNNVDTNSRMTQSRPENKETFSMREQKPEYKSTSLRNDHQSKEANTYTPLSQSVPPNSRTSHDTSIQRSQSVSPTKLSNVPAINSKDHLQQQQNIHPSSSSPSPSQRSQMTNPSNKPSVDPGSFKASYETTRENQFKKPQVTSSSIIDPTFNKYNSQPNSQAISAVTIHTIATNSDSDSNVTRTSIESRDSEHSVHSKSLLSPDIAKKSRKNRRRERRQHTPSEQTAISQSSTSTNSSITNNVSNDVPSINNKYLSKEASDIQYAARPSSNKSKPDNISSTVERKSSNTAHERVQPSQDTLPNVEPLTQETQSKDKDILSQTTRNSSLNTSTTTSNSLISSTTTQSHRLPNGISDTEHSVSHQKQLKIDSNFPNKLNGVDHMSTVYEESEPSTISTSNKLTSSTGERDHNRENRQEWIETTSTISSIQPNASTTHRNISPTVHKIKNSSKEKSLSNILQKTSSPFNHHKKTITAKTKLAPVKSNTSTDYEFRVQTGNESALDGTNEPVFIELTNMKDNTIKIPLINPMNNSQPFQKGQLDIFHLNIPKNFHTIKKLNLSLPKSNKDPLHIRYCELQERQTMNTLHFPIEKWLGEKNTYNVEMYINNNNTSVF